VVVAENMQGAKMYELVKINKIKYKFEGESWMGQAGGRNYQTRS